VPSTRFSMTLDDDILTLPQAVSDMLHSRGMVMIQGTINGTHFRSVLQPDGQGSHWMKLDTKLCSAAKVDGKHSISLEITPIKEWPEPRVPTHLLKALAADPEAQTQWLDITPMARWDWLNWLGSVKLPQTQRQRPAKLCSMLKAGKRRPCCFNRSLQTPPSTAHIL
jgi:hypothetical protein